MIEKPLDPPWLSLIAVTWHFIDGFFSENKPDKQGRQQPTVPKSTHLHGVQIFPTPSSKPAYNQNRAFLQMKRHVKIDS
ncbi:hypothetical protein IFR53_25990 [Pseudomonas syringae]|nr:hypothetical protein [Pseudomonas syringae]